MEVIQAKGGSSVQEVEYNSVPDILFELGSRPWLLSVKIGEELSTLKNAFLQYLRHKEESGIEFGILLLLPESVRKVRVSEAEIKEAIQKLPVTALIDADFVKEEVRDRTFPELIDFLIEEVLARLDSRRPTYYPLTLVISLLRQQVMEMMEEIAIEEETILRIITDRDLLMDLGKLESHHAEAVARFLASYIFLSQVLFLRLLATARLDIQPVHPVSRNTLRKAFSKILDINYRPIYEVDVLDVIPGRYIEETFNLIRGLAIEHIRYELPGRIFHELMPSQIRKMLAAFYTRPQAADLLARLTIPKAEATVFDPACGSGTILTSAYRVKSELWKKEGKVGDPHRRFCEEEIIGADIMPFAVHLTSANLAAMNPAISIERTQVLQGDSLCLEPKTYLAGLQLGFFPETPKAKTAKGEEYEVELKPVDVILMNPPFTKVERGIRRFVDMERFSSRCGGEVGLWGHFVILADYFLKDKGMFGAVLPINVLRGRESAKIRKLLFEEWTPLYILKPTRNYGFSEWAEYRDVLFIAQKEKPKPDHQVKFCLIKRDLTKLTELDIKHIADQVMNHSRLRNDDLVDIDSHKLSDVKKRFNNMMWFCGAADFYHRDLIEQFVHKVMKNLTLFPRGDRFCKTGYRLQEGLAKILFLTRHLEDTRIEKAFLSFSSEGEEIIQARSPLGTIYEIEKNCLKSSLRTPVGVRTMDLSDACDYIAQQPYRELERVCRAARVKLPRGEFWRFLPKRLSGVETHLAITRRINPFSPDNYLIAFFSLTPFSPSDQMNIIIEPDTKRARALCLILNSIVFLAQFFLLKEESTGRYIDLRLYDLEEMYLIPSADYLDRLSTVFDHYGKVEFPALRKQLDENFDQRYEEFWERERGNGQRRLWSVLEKPVKPFPERLAMDLAVCNALGISITEDEIIQLYEAIVNEMIIIRGLRRD